MEFAVFDDDILARLWVTAVAVGSFIPDLHTFHQQVLTNQRVDNPERRTQQRDVLDGYIVALIQIDELRTQTRIFHVTLFERFACLAVFEQQRTTNLLTFLQVGRPTETVFAAHLPPGVVASVTVDGSLTGNGDVLLTVSVDTGLVVHTVHTFPSCQNDGEEFLVESKKQLSVFLDFQIYVALQRNRTRLKCAGWYNHLTAAFLGTLVNSLVDGLLILGCSCFFGCTVLRNQERTVSKRRFLNAFFDLLVGCCIPVVSQCYHRHQQTEQHQFHFSHDLFGYFVINNLFV